MASTDQPDSLPPDDRPRSRLRRVLVGSRELIRIAYRDPEHVAERLTLYGVGRLADESRNWALLARTARPDSAPEDLAEELRIRSAQIARIDGAVSGTPFLFALVPGYLMYLWQEMRMTLRTAALYGRDPGDPETAAEMLALRQVHPTVEAAESALAAIRGTPMPDRPTGRRSLRLWVDSGYRLLVFGGFLSPSAAEPKKGIRATLRTGFSLVAGAVIWVITWVFPVTFMIMMAWGCETHSRSLGHRTIAFYDSEEAAARAKISVGERRHGGDHRKRALARSAALFLSIAVPIAFVAYANHVRKSTGITWFTALGSLVAVSLVIATAVISTRSVVDGRSGRHADDPLDDVARDRQ
jgi:hypothetical protein